MIQDYFSDLGVVVNNEAEIYQYVGDEVILTWKLKNGLRNEICLNAYFNFKRELEKRVEHYTSNYGFVPFFKAGLNEGIVTVTEVGKFKKEIAYHGDTINTAARIQGKCNELNQAPLISGNLKDQLTASNFNFDEMGSIPLKGKAQMVDIFAVAAEK
jgi:adenylate cyclase